LFPFAASYAASVPEAATITRSSITSGELEKPQSGTFRFVSAETLRDQSSLPLRASSAFRIPVEPKAKTRPLPSVGVPRGPKSPLASWKRTGSP
jgi:hypothetical protein